MVFNSRVVPLGVIYVKVAYLFRRCILVLPEILLRRDRLYRGVHRGTEAGGILGVNTPHFLDLLKKFSIFHGQSSGFRKSETATLFNYYISQISVVAKDEGGNFHSVIISQMLVFACSKIKNRGQYLMNAEHSKLLLKTSCITRFVLDG